MIMIYDLISYLGIGFVPPLLSPDPSRHQPVFDAVSQREVVISGRGDIPILKELPEWIFLPEGKART